MVRSLVLRLIPAAVCLVGACGGGSDGADSANQDLFAIGKVPPEWDRAVTRPASEGAAAAARASCKFGKGAMPGETLGAELPLEDDIPIQKIVVLMQENRSFDSYFGHLGKYAKRDDIESAPEDASNPENVSDPNSPRHPYQHAPSLCFSDTNHEWAGSHLQFDGGKMDGFFQSNHGYIEDKPNTLTPLTNGERALWYYDERDIPFYYELATTFAIGDHYHASILGPTWPNRDYLYAATSRGVTTATRPKFDEGFPAGDSVIFDELERRKVSWDFYVDGALVAARLGVTLSPAQLLTRYRGVHQDFMDVFYDRVKKGKLTQVSFIDANFHEDVHGNDEHPPGDIQSGQMFASDVVHALMESPEWPHVALFIVYDEHGGLYDHVAPPPACAPDGIAPDLQSDEDKAFPGDFARYGVRVPITVVSPYAKRGYVSHHVYDHTSITRFIEAKFKVPALTARDANADAMYDFFDFKSPPFLTPPNLSRAIVDPDGMRACEAMFK
jgi:phospholipase C